MVDTQVRVINKHGEDVAQDSNEQGDIVVKGSGVIDDGSGNFTKDGWLYTSDIGTVDENGRIDVVDRKNDRSSSSGEEVSIVELENTLSEHPTIREVAVIAIPHKNLDEILHAFVVLHEGASVTEREIIEFSKDKLPHSQLYPTAITFLDELPKTTSGKALKLQLKNLI